MNYYFILIFLGMAVSSASYAMYAEKQSTAKPSRGSMSPQLLFAYVLKGCKETLTSVSTYTLPAMSVCYYINQNWNSIYNNGNGMNYRNILPCLRQGVVNSTIIGGTLGGLIINGMPWKKYVELHSSLKFVLMHPYITSYSLATVYTLAKNYLQNGQVIRSVQDQHMLAGLGLVLTFVGGKYVWNNYQKWIPTDSIDDGLVEKHK